MENNVIDIRTREKRARVMASLTVNHVDGYVVMMVGGIGIPLTVEDTGRLIEALQVAKKGAEGRDPG